MTTTDTVRAGLVSVVTGLNEVATAAGLAETVAPLLAECARPAGGTARVVVAGATKRGKSALVNALLGHPDLVPVDADVATGVHIALRWGPVMRVVVHRAEADPVEVPSEELGRYASERHNPGNTLGVLAVEVELPAPVLDGGLELVDTPGVDSVALRHTDVTLAALALADALVLVVDPSRPLIASELAFLADATTRVGQVTFVLTKTDLYREWRRILDDDRALVAAHAPRFATAPFLPVSAKLASAARNARDAGRVELAERVTRESGVDDLSAVLRRIAQDRDMVRLGNVVQLALVVAGRIDAAVRAAAPPADVPGTAAAVDADRERLQALADTGSQWRQELAHGFVLLAQDLDAHLVRVGAGLEQSFTDSLNTAWTPERGETLPRELDDAVRVLWLETVALVRERVSRIVDDVIETVAAHGVTLAPPELVTPQLHREPTRQVEVDEDPSASGLAGVIGTVGPAAALGFGAGRVLFLVNPLLGVAGAGLGAAIGLAGMALRRRAVARVRERAAARALARTTLAEARGHAAREFRRHLTDTQYTLDRTVAALLADRRRELDDAVARGRDLLARDSAERERCRHESAELLRRLGTLRAEAGGLHHACERARTVT